MCYATFSRYLFQANLRGYCSSTKDRGTVGPLPFMAMNTASKRCFWFTTHNLRLFQHTFGTHPLTFPNRLFIGKFFTVGSRGIAERVCSWGVLQLSWIQVTGMIRRHLRANEDVAACTPPRMAEWLNTPATKIAEKSFNRKFLSHSSRWAPIALLLI